MIKLLDLVIEVLNEIEAPAGIVSYLSRISLNGTKELINHKNIDLILNTGVDEILPEIYKTGKHLCMEEMEILPLLLKNQQIY